jgi:hypothetical protein
VFRVFGLTRGDCDAQDAHVDREVLLTEDLATGQALQLCPKCFLAQLRLRAKGKKAEPAAGPGVPPFADGRLPPTP